MSVEPALPRFTHYIDGERVEPRSGRYFPTEDPFSGRAWASVARGDAEDVDRAVQSANRALNSGAWPEMTATQRGHALWKLGDLVTSNAGRLAEIEQRDNGKLSTEVTAQVKYMGDYFKYYAGLADKIQSAVIPTDKKGVFAYTKYEPKGVVAIITPWNSPLTLTSWKLAPALAAGCTAVVKPSEFTSASMVELAALASDAGLPRGVVNVVTGFGAEVGEPLVTHPLVRHVGFTGGGVAGRKIYELAARGLKTVTLELGGKSPNIVFDDADFDRAVKGVVSGIFAASGQSCQAGSRLLLQSSYVLRSSAIPRFPRRRSVRFRPGRSSSGFFPISKLPRRKERSAYWAGAVDRISVPVSSSSQPYLRACAMTCGSPRKKCSVRSCR
jgi:(Z)-2-((N-methylformamido)methylene)-5-hydroxybutyrolactone dehydrogenase